jgi:PPOX class probable F420-dependent enzyme
MLSDYHQLARFLSAPRNAVVGTVDPDGSPHLTPVWYHYTGDCVYFFTRPDSRKVRNLQRDPRVTLCVDEPGPLERCAIIRGRAEIVREGWLPAYRRLVERYLGDVEAVERRVERVEHRHTCLVRVHIDEVIAWG